MPFNRGFFKMDQELKRGATMPRLDLTATSRTKIMSDNNEGSGGYSSGGQSSGGQSSGGQGSGGQGPSRIFDEFAKLMTDAAGVAQGARREVEGALKGQAERIMDHMDLVQRDEFEAVKEMASKARMENDAMRKEIETLKKQFGGTAKPKVANKKPAAKK